MLAASSEDGEKRKRQSKDINELKKELELVRYVFIYSLILQLKDYQKISLKHCIKIFYYCMIAFILFF